MNLSGTHDGVDPSARARTARRAAISWSGGKDSCLAWLRACESGFEVDTFLTMCGPDGLSLSHALSPVLVGEQVRVAGGLWRAARVAPGEYARVFDAELRGLREAGHSRMIFGDIDLQAHRDWLESACARAGIDAVFPLWGEARAAVADEIVGRGVRARIVCVDASRLDAAFCGLDYDRELIARLPAGVCPCGEDGEFHTFVFDAPGFARPLAIRNGEQRRVVAAPPLAPTEQVLQVLTLAAGRIR